MSSISSTDEAATILAKDVIIFDPNKVATLDSIAQLFLKFISFLDSNLGMKTWNLRYTAFVTVLILYIIRKKCKSWHGIEWYSFIHAIISGYGSFIACYVSMSSKELVGIEEPFRVSTNMSLLYFVLICRFSYTLIYII